MLRRVRSPTPGLKWYEKVVDSAVQAELEIGRRTATEGLADLAQWEQLSWPQVDSLKAFVGPKAADEAVAKGAAKRVPANLAAAGIETPLTALQWTWRAYEARRQARMAVMDVRLLKARRDGK